MSKNKRIDVHLSDERYEKLMSLVTALSVKEQKNYSLSGYINRLIEKEAKKQKRNTACATS